MNGEPPSLFFAVVRRASIGPKKSNQIFEAYVASYGQVKSAQVLFQSIFGSCCSSVALLPRKEPMPPSHCNRLFLPLKNGNKKHI